MKLGSLQSAGRALHLSPRAGRGRIALTIRVRGVIRKRSGNDFKHTSHIAKHVAIPKSQDPVVMIGKPFVAGNIAPVVGVLPSIDFNDKTTFAANKIDCVRTDRFLPNELESVQPARPQPIPKPGLRLRGVLPQTPCTLGLDLSSSTHAATPPHPDCYAIRPLPARGERLAPRAGQ